MSIVVDGVEVDAMPLPALGDFDSSDKEKIVNRLFSDSIMAYEKASKVSYYHGFLAALKILGENETQTFDEMIILARSLTEECRDYLYS